MQIQKSLSQNPEVASELLTQAFERFSAASAQLQEKYLLLKDEVSELRAKLRQKEEEIQRTEKLATLGETAAALAHEIRNPLGAIKLFASLLKQDLANQPESLELVEQIDTSIHSLDHVVTNILQFARNKKPDMTPLNLHAVIRDCVSSLVSPHEQVELKLEIDGSPFVRANEHGIRQILHNLIRNSLQAMRYKGVLQVACHDTCSDSIKLSIEDSGPGVDPTLGERIFDPFVTSKNEGTGLGLAIVRQILEAHGALIEVRNNPGARFEILIPRNAEKRG